MATILAKIGGVIVKMAFFCHFDNYRASTCEIKL